MNLTIDVSVSSRDIFNFVISELMSIALTQATPGNMLAPTSVSFIDGKIVEPLDLSLVLVAQSSTC